MTYVVTESCIKCKYTDCVEVCPVDCFHEGPNMLVIDPEECIDCTLCEPECPVEAICSEDDIPEGQEHFLELNAELSENWPVITEAGDPARRCRRVGGCRRQAPIPGAIIAADFPASDRKSPSNGASWENPMTASSIGVFRSLLISVLLISAALPLAEALGYEAVDVGPVRYAHIVEGFYLLRSNTRDMLGDHFEYHLRRREIGVPQEIR